MATKPRDEIVQGILDGLDASTTTVDALLPLAARRGAGNGARARIRGALRRLGWREDVHGVWWRADAIMTSPQKKRHGLDAVRSPDRPRPASWEGVRRCHVWFLLNGVTDTSTRKIFGGLVQLGIAVLPLHVTRWMVEFGWTPYFDARGFRRFSREA